MKIGKTKDIKKRYKSIKAMNPNVVLFSCCVANNIHVLESKVHKAFSESRIHGEWFRVTPKEAAEAMADLLIEDQNGYHEVNPVCVNSCQIVIENKARACIK